MKRKGKDKDKEKKGGEGSFFIIRQSLKLNLKNLKNNTTCTNFDVCLKDSKFPKTKPRGVG